MTWAHQKQVVEQLSALGLAKKREARHLRVNLKRWMGSYVGSLDTVAWTFAIGSWWAAGRLPAGGKSNGRRALIGVINASWLAWQLANREVRWKPPEPRSPTNGKQ